MLGCYQTLVNGWVVMMLGKDWLNLVLVNTAITIYIQPWKRSYKFVSANCGLE